MVAGVPSKHFEGVHILGKAGTTEADTRPQEARADALVKAHAAGDLGDVGPGLLADVGDLVDERDLGCEEGVGRELDHLGRGDVGAHDLAAKRGVEARNCVGGVF